MTSKVERLMTVWELEAIPEDNNRYELIEGELFVSPAPGIPHQLLLHKLQVELAVFLKTHPLGKVVPGPGVVFDNYNEVVPDLCFVSNERWQESVSNARFVRAPDLVIEILSPGNQNLTRDLIAKRRLYAKFGVKEYWIVDGVKEEVIVFHLQHDELVQAPTVKAPNELVSDVVQGLRIDLAMLFSES